MSEIPTGPRRPYRREPRGPPPSIEPLRRPAAAALARPAPPPPRILPIVHTQIQSYDGEPRRLIYGFAEDPLSSEASYQKAKQAIADVWDFECTKKQLKTATLELQGPDFISGRMPSTLMSTDGAWDRVRMKQLPHIDNAFTVVLRFKEVPAW